MTEETEQLSDYLTEEIIQNFEETGSQVLVNLILSPDKSQADLDDTTSQVFTEILLALDENRLDIAKVAKFLQLSINDEKKAIIFCEVFDSFPLSSNLQGLLMEIHNHTNIIKNETIASCISIDSIIKSAIVPPDVLTKQLNVKKRDEFYTQKKFNLLHEELEGYSKLIVEVYNILKNTEDDYEVSYAIRVVEQLIGHYNLDPNRVLDILIDVFSSNFVSRSEFVLTFFKASRWWPSVDSDCFSTIDNLSKGGNESAAKIIGLRLSKQPLDKELPETLKILFACLIKEGFVSFGSIYKYMSPGDDEMSNLEVEFKKSLEEEAFKAGASALALAAPLKDDEAVGNSENERMQHGGNADNNSEESLEKRINSNTKIQFLKVLLGNGLYYPSIFMLTKYPFLANIDPEVSVLINRLYNSMIDPLYRRLSQFNDCELSELQVSRKVAFSRPFNNIRYEEYPCTDLLSFKPCIKSYSQKKFHYFYKDWDKKIPLAHDIPSLFVLTKEFFRFNVMNLSKDLELFTKLCRIGVRNLSDKDDGDVKGQWLNFFRNYIFPAIPLIQENPIAIEEAYAFLSFYSYEERYNLYSELHQVLSKNNPFIKIAYSRAEKATKDVLKRLSKENVRPMMRRLAKISFCNPLPCFLAILQQIESYDNLILLVVETARYFNSFGWDCLTLAILIRLTVPGRANTQADGLNARQWIQSLANFVGKISKKYPDCIDLKTLICFFLKSLHKNEDISIILLRELFVSMGGIQNTNNLTLKQIDMISSGRSLERIVYRTIGDTRYQSTKSGTVLVNTLVDIDAMNELFILLNNLESRAIQDNENTSHLKVLANQIDELINIKHLFIDTISFFGSKAKIRDMLISISDFKTEYGIFTSWIFELWRGLTELSTSDEVWKGQMEEILTYCTQLLPKSVWEVLSKELYVIFWMLRLHDINYSQELYEAELASLKSSQASTKDILAISRKDRDISRSKIDELKQRISEDEKYLMALPDEEKIHHDRNEKLKVLVLNLSGSWFASSDAQETDSTLTAFLQHCVLPRAIHSPFDASFSAKFIFYLHRIGVQNFDIFLLLNKVFQDRIIFGTLFTCTSGEAETLGLFVSEILKQLCSWTDEKKFEREVGDTYRKIDEMNKKSNFSDYRDLLYGYHSALLREVRDALTVTEYMCRRNVITFLKYLVGIYPNVEDQCEIILQQITKVSQEEKREDLKLSANALIGHLKSRSKEWISLWEFIDMTDSEKEEHVKKRNHIKEERKKAELEDKKRKRELDLRQSLQRDQKSQERQASVLNYDEKNSNSARPDSRSADYNKSRYDYYSKYSENKKVGSLDDNKEREKFNRDNGDEEKADVKKTEERNAVENKVHEKKADENKVHEKKADENKIDENKIDEKKADEKKPEGNVSREEIGKDEEGMQMKVESHVDDSISQTGSKSTELKMRILEAKKELNKAKSSDKEQDAQLKISTQNNEYKNAPTSSKRTSSTEINAGRTRKSLPPQSVVARSEVSESNQDKVIQNNRKPYEQQYGGNRNGRKFYQQGSYKHTLSKSQNPHSSRTPPYRSDSSSNHIPPPPPPPPPPPISQRQIDERGGPQLNPSSKGGRYNNKRKFDGSGRNERDFDKKYRHN